MSLEYKDSFAILWSFSLMAPIKYYLDKDIEHDELLYSFDHTITNGRLYFVNTAEAVIKSLESINGMTIDEIKKELS